MTSRAVDETISRVRWEDSHGQFKDDLERKVLATRGMRLPLEKISLPVEKKMPFDIESVPPGAKLINGDIDMESAKRRVESEVQALHRSKAAGSVDELISVNTNVQVGDAQLLTIPLWFIRYRYKNKSYSIITDGSTGRVIEGQAPRGIPRVLKIAATALASFVGIILTFLYPALFGPIFLCAILAASSLAISKRQTRPNLISKLGKTLIVVGVVFLVVGLVLTLRPVYGEPRTSGIGDTITSEYYSLYAPVDLQGSDEITITFQCGDADDEVLVFIMKRGDWERYSGEFDIDSDFIADWYPFMVARLNTPANSDELKWECGEGGTYVYEIFYDPYNYGGDYPVPITGEEVITAVNVQLRHLGYGAIAGAILLILVQASKLFAVRQQVREHGEPGGI